MTDTTLDIAEGWLAEGRAAEALMAAEQALAQGRGGLRAEALRGRALAAIQAMDPAFAALQLGAAIHADNPAAHLDLGHAYLTQGRLADAERCFKAALALDPGSAEAHASLARAYLAAGIAAGAEHHARQALERDPAQAVACQTLASLLEERGETAQAQALLARAYARQALFAQPAADPVLRVLVLAVSSAGNTPYPALMPPSRYSRLVWYMDHARVEETPDPALYDVVFNTAGDADLIEDALPALERFAAACPKAVINPPSRMARTRRDRLADLFADIRDVVVPRTVRVEGGLVARLGLPALAREHGFEGETLARPSGLHGGKGLVRAASPEALPGQAEGPHYLTDYVDYRSPDGLFRKYRILFVDRRPFPYHLAISDGWLVHHESSGMHGHAARRAEEARFLEHPQGALGARAMAALGAIGQALDLDYAGVDFSLLDDGRVLVFEANATMLAHIEDPEGPYAHKNPCVEAIARAFQALLARRVS